MLAPAVPGAADGGDGDRFQVRGGADVDLVACGEAVYAADLNLVAPALAFAEEPPESPACRRA